MKLDTTWGVIGVGNPYRSDDGVGWLVAKQLAAQLGMECHLSDGDAADLIAFWRHKRHILLIDAIASGADPGTLHRYDVLRDGLPEVQFTASTHDFGIGTAVALARQIEALPERLIAYGIEATSFDHGDTLSAAVEAAINPLCQKICNDLFGVDDARDVLDGRPAEEDRTDRT